MRRSGLVGGVASTRQRDEAGRSVCEDLGIGGRDEKGWLGLDGGHPDLLRRWFSAGRVRPALVRVWALTTHCRVCAAEKRDVPDIRHPEYLPRIALWGGALVGQARSAASRLRVFCGAAGYCRSTADLMSAIVCAASSRRRARSARRGTQDQTRLAVVGFRVAAGLSQNLVAVERLVRPLDGGHHVEERDRQGCGPVGSRRAARDDDRIPARVSACSCLFRYAAGQLVEGRQLGRRRLPLQLDPGQVQAAVERPLNPSLIHAILEFTPSRSVGAARPTSGSPWREFGAPCQAALGRRRPEPVVVDGRDRAAPGSFQV